MEGIRELLGSLRLTTDEEKAVKVQHCGEKTATERLEFLIIAKLMIVRRILPKILERTLRMAWRLKEGFNVEAANHTHENIFIIRFEDQEDRRWVMEHGPWSFDDKALIMTGLRSGEQISDLKWDKILLWIHITDLPVDWVTESLAVRLRNAVGNVVQVETSHNSCRILAWMKTREPLRRLVRTEDDKGKIREFPLLYEKLPDICFRCGRLDHVEKECREPSIQKREENRPYGVWMRYSTRQSGRKGAKKDIVENSIKEKKRDTRGEEEEEKKHSAPQQESSGGIRTGEGSGSKVGEAKGVQTENQGETGEGGAGGSRVVSLAGRESKQKERNTDPDESQESVSPGEMKLRRGSRVRRKAEKIRMKVDAKCGSTKRKMQFDLEESGMTEVGNKKTKTERMAAAGEIRGCQDK